MRSVLATAFAVLLGSCAGNGVVVPASQQSAAVQSAAQRAEHVTPIEQFVAAQGTCPPDQCGPLAGSYVAFVGENGAHGCPPNYNLVADIDYAGLDNAAIAGAGGASLGTSFNGSVSIAPQRDGSAIVKVELDTSHALAFAYCLTPAGGPDAFPLLFGYRPPEVLSGAPPALARSHLSIVFAMPSPTSPMPDYAQLAFVPFTLPGYALLAQKFNATAAGPLRAQFGAAPGTEGGMNVSEVGLTRKGPFAFEDRDGFAAESVRIHAQ